jgi:hypothetical protein
MKLWALGYASYAGSAQKKWRDDSDRKATSELNGPKWKGGSEGDAEDGFKGKIEEATTEETTEGGEVIVEETSDGGKATLTEDPEKRMRKRQRRRPNEWNGEMSEKNRRND